MGSRRARKGTGKSRKRKGTTKTHTERKQKGTKKNDQKCTESDWDLHTFINDRKEMIKRSFAAVGERFLVEKIPVILQKTSREELKKICLEELSKMSTEVVLEILRGIPVNVQFTSQPEDPNGGSGSAMKMSFGNSSRGRSREIKKAERKPFSVVDRSDEVENDTTDDDKKCIQLYKEEMDLNEDNYPKDHSSDIKEDAPSTSFQEPLLPIVISKVAPFKVCIGQLLPDPMLAGEEEVIDLNPVMVEEEDNVDLPFQSTDEDEDVDVETIDNVENEEDDDMMSPGISISEVFQDIKLPLCTVDQVLSSLKEMIELEHRARAIRSMITNMSKLEF